MYPLGAKSYLPGVEIRAKSWWRTAWPCQSISATYPSVSTASGCFRWAFLVVIKTRFLLGVIELGCARFRTCSGMLSPVYGVWRSSFSHVSLHPLWVSARWVYQFPHVSGGFGPQVGMGARSLKTSKCVHINARGGTVVQSGETK